MPLWLQASSLRNLMTDGFSRANRSRIVRGLLVRRQRLRHPARIAWWRPMLW